MFGPVADAMERRGLPCRIVGGRRGHRLFSALIAIRRHDVRRADLRVGRAWSAALAEAAGSSSSTSSEPLRRCPAISGAAQEAMGGGAVDDRRGAGWRSGAGRGADGAILLADILAVPRWALLLPRDPQQHPAHGAVPLLFAAVCAGGLAHIFRDVETKVSRFLLSASHHQPRRRCRDASSQCGRIGMPSPLLWGGLAAVLNFIPYIGQAIMLAILFAVGLGTHSRHRSASCCRSRSTQPSTSPPTNWSSRTWWARR